MMSYFVNGTSTFLGLGVVANIMLGLCLAHTWLYWRKVKYYILVLAVGNALEVTFSYGIEITRAQDSTWTTDTHACRFFMFTYFLGPSLANMALAALAIHVLLVGITGNQGENKRHVTIIGLFVLLSLILPLSRIPMFQVSGFEGEIQECGIFNFFVTEEHTLYDFVGTFVAEFFFPLAVILIAGGITLALIILRNGDIVKTEVSPSDLALTSLLGGVLAITGLPFVSYSLYARYNYGYFNEDLFFRFQLFSFVKPLATAVVCVLFAYVMAFRARDTGYTPPIAEQSPEVDERQKLVN